MWGSVSQVRLISNLSIDDISDNDIESFLVLATDEIWSIIYSLAIRDTPSKYNDNWYKLSYNFIGDYNKDGSIDSSDINVYIEGNNPDERTSVTVTDIDSDNGLVKLDIDIYNGTLYADYCYSFKKINMSLVNYATSLLASKYILLRRVLLKPLSFKIGNIRVSYGIRGEYAPLINIEKRLNSILEFLTTSSLSSDYELDFYEGVKSDLY